MVTISVNSNNNANEYLPLAIHVITGLTTVVCLACCAVSACSLREMELWLVGALVAFSLNRFGSGVIGRMITI